MAQRVVYTFKMIEVQAEHPKMLSPLRTMKRLLKMLTKQHAIGQICEHIMARQIGDLRLGAASLRYIFVNGHPSARDHCLMRNGDDTSIDQLPHERGRSLSGSDGRGDIADLLSRISDRVIPYPNSMMHNFAQQRTRLGQTLR